MPAATPRRWISDRVWRRDRWSCVIGPRLPAKVLAVPVGLAVFPLKTLLTGPRFDQRAIHRKVLIGHQSVRAVHHAAEKAPRDLLIEQSIAIFGEHRRVPNRVVHRETNEPAKQQVVVKLLHQQALAADRI